MFWKLLCSPTFSGQSDSCSIKVQTHYISSYLSRVNVMLMTWSTWTSLVHTGTWLSLSLLSTCNMNQRSILVILIHRRTLYGSSMARMFVGVHDMCVYIHGCLSVQCVDEHYRTESMFLVKLWSHQWFCGSEINSHRQGSTSVFFPSSFSLGTTLQNESRRTVQIVKSWCQTYFMIYEPGKCFNLYNTLKCHENRISELLLTLRYKPYKIFNGLIKNPVWLK